MHIEVELDDIHSERLAVLQSRLQKPLPEVLATVLATVIDWAMAQSPQAFGILPEPMSVGDWRDIDLSREGLYGDDGR